jgi:hypothetical protein
VSPQLLTTATFPVRVCQIHTASAVRPVPASRSLGWPVAGSHSCTVSPTPAASRRLMYVDALLAFPQVKAYIGRGGGI